MPSDTTAGTGSRGDRLLSAVERAGNKLPQPLFLILFLVTGVVSTGLAWPRAGSVRPGKTRSGGERSDLALGVAR